MSAIVHRARGAVALPQNLPRGPIRSASDAEHDAVAAFVAKYPEYARLSHAELVTLAATYVGPERRVEKSALEDAGVPEDWQPGTEVDGGEAA